MTHPLDQLYDELRQRSHKSDADASYTARLLAKGRAKIAQKLGEEAVETVIAAIKNDPEELVKESADLLYHWLVLLIDAGVAPEAVYGELEHRRGLSGLEEKRQRS